jgi:ATP-dependent helicase/nuclease subunit B
MPASTNSFPAAAPRQNTLLAALAGVCRQHPLAEKWLLCPSRRVGQQWLESLARTGTPGVNLHLHTVATLALAATPPTPRPLVTPLGRVVIAAQLLRELGNSYLGGLPPSLALAQRIAGTLHDLRLADIPLAQLERAPLEVPAKRRDLAALLAGYRRELDRRQLADDTDLLQTQPALPAHILVLLPADLELAAVQRRFLDQLPAAQRLVLPVDDPSEAPPDDSFRAIGETNEIREVFRRCLANGWPLDHVEILHTDSTVYLPRLFETTEALGIPATFAEGVPVAYTRPGRALAAFLAWIRDDYPQTGLLAMLRDGLLRDLTGASAGALRIVPIGFGRARYLAQLELALAATAEPWLHRRDQLTALREPLRRLLDCAAQPPRAAAAAFLEHHARSVNELDNFARDVLTQRLAELADWLPADADGREWLPVLLAETRVRGEGPRPGHVHVARWDSGGHTGREYTFLLGLDAGRFPPAARPDPVLLDRERRAISPDLPTAARHRAEARQRFARLRGRLRGPVTGSYTWRSLTGDAEQAPGLALPAPTVAATAPGAETGALSDTDWWLWRLCGDQPVCEAEKLAGEISPWLRRGLFAAAQRGQEVFTAHDGLVPDAGPALDPVGHPDRVFSAHRLETIGACPRRYFFRYALQIEPPDELDLDPERWLTPIEFGNLLHDVFCRHLRDGVPLETALEQNLAKWRGKIPPPNEGVRRRDERRLRRAIRIFAAEPWTGKPVKFEFEIPAQPVPLADGRPMFVKGRIDRVDEVPGGLELWDYKTGGVRRYAVDKKDALRAGRMLQHTLYLQIAATFFGQPTTQFKYYFPTDKGRGETIAYTPAQLAHAPTVLGHLRQLIATGCFPATNKEEDCSYCDYRAICRDVATVVAQTAGKLRSPVNNALAPFRELRP